MRDAVEAPGRPAMPWLLGCFIASIALLGVFILVLLIALALQPPAWLQVLVGVLLAGSGALLAWLVASALRQAEHRRTRPRLQRVRS